MQVVDSSGWLAFFEDGANAAQFEAIIDDPASLIVPTISIFEVARVVERERGAEAALDAVAKMMTGKLIDLTADLALEAAALAAHHRLPMADSIILATARRFEATLWTQDADFAGLDGVRYLPKEGTAAG